VATMGYMVIITGDLLEQYGSLPSHQGQKYEARMVNTHPGPLPETADTWGIHASERVLERGLANSAHTVHVVAGPVDLGEIVAVHSVPVVDGDTPEALFDRVQATEKAMLPGALND